MLRVRSNMLHPWQHEHRQRRAASCSLVTLLGLVFLAACSYSAAPHATRESELNFLLPNPPTSKLHGHAIGVLSPSLGAAASGAEHASGAVGVLAFTVALATVVFSAGGRQRALVQRHAKGKPLEELNVGETVAGTVKRVANIGVWIDIGASKDALLAKNEVPPGKTFKPGDNVTDLEIIELQTGDTPATRKIKLKAKQAELGVSEGDIVEGTVQKASSFGVFFDIGCGFDVLAPSRNLGKKADEYTEGEKVQVRVDSIAGNRITVTTNIGSSQDELGGKSAGKAIKELKEGAVVAGVVSNTSTFGIFMDIGAEKEALWRTNQLDKPLSEYAVGDKVDGLKIASVNVEKKLVEVTTRRLTSELKVGEILEGTVSQVSKFGVFFNAGLSTDVLAPAKGLSKQMDTYTQGEVADLKVIKVEGSRVTVTTVLEEKIVRGQTVTGTVKNIDPKLGIFLDVGDPMDAFLRIKFLGDKSLSDYSIGDEVEGLTVTQLDRANGILEVSTAEGLAAMAKNPLKSIASLPVGTKVNGKITKKSQFGIFLDIGSTRDALWATSQLPKPASEFQEGEEITGLTVVESNAEIQRLAVSTKPIASDYNIGDLVSGKVTKILPFGIFVDIGASNDALVPARYLAKEPTEYAENEEFADWKILSTDPSANKISVAETDGSSGGVAGRLSYEDLTVGQKIKGVVRRSTNFGVFVDIAIGRTDALLPGSLMTEGTNPEDFDVNTEIEVYVHNINAMEGKVTLGMEQPEEEGSGTTYQPDWIPPGDMLPDLKLWKLEDEVIDEESIDWRAWEKKYPGMISFPKDGEREVYFNVNKGGGHWWGAYNMYPSQVTYMPVPMHLRKPDADPPVIPARNLDDYDMGYDKGIKPEIDVKYRAPPMNDPNWVWYDRVPDGVDP